MRPGALRSDPRAETGVAGGLAVGAGFGPARRDCPVHRLSRATPSTSRPTNHVRLMQDSNLRSLGGSSVFKTGAINLSANQPLTVLGRRAVSGRNVTARRRC